MFRTLSLRYLRRRRLRALLVIASIALGVAALVATRSLNRTMIRAGQTAVNPLAGVADLQITNGDFGLPIALVNELRANPVAGVAALRPLVLGRVALSDRGNAAALILGVDWETGEFGDNPWGIEAKITRPLALLGKNAVLVGRTLAESLPNGIGSIRVRCAGKDLTLNGAGTVDAHGPAAALGGSMLVMKGPEAASCMGHPGFVSRVDVALAPSADKEAVRRQLEAIVNGRGDVLSPEVAAQGFQDVIAGLELGLSLNGAGALVIGLFLVYNALSVSVEERRHDIGVLRSVGATRFQVGALFAKEAGLLGLAGAAIGLPLGIGLVQLALVPVQRTLQEIFGPLELHTVDYTASILIGSSLAGVLTALAAGLAPSLRAAFEEPADAVRRVPRSATGWARVLHIAAVLSFLGGGFAMIALREQLPRRVGTFMGMIVIFLACLLAMPLITSVWARLLRPLAHRWLGIEVRLAADNLARSPGRTGIVVAALAAGIALVLQTAGVILSSERAVLDWVDSSLGADLFVTANSPVSSGGEGLPMSAALGPKLSAIPGVEAAPALRMGRIDFRGFNVFLLAFEAHVFHAANEKRPWIAGRRQYGLLEQPGRCLISDNFAAMHKVKVGDRLPLRGVKGEFELEVVGTLLDYSWNRGTIFMTLNEYRDRFEDPLVDVFDVYVRPDADIEKVREEMSRRHGAEESLVILTKPELRDRISSMIRRLHGIAYAQELVVGLVAALGVVTALLIAVLQRTRELGLLRAVGASRSQLLKSVLAEATLLGFIGAVVGILLGLPLEWYVVRVILFDESGFILPMRVPWLAVGIMTTLSLVTATLAGLGPALQAMRLRIPDAIAYE